MTSARWFAVAVALALTGCDSLDDTWLGSNEAPPLPGERIPVMLLDSGLDVDEDLAAVPVRLPAPIPTPNWPQSGGVADHAMHHIEATGPLVPAWKTNAGEGSGKYDRVLATPIIVLGSVFTMDAAGEVTAFAADSGAQRWRTETFPEDEDEGGLGGGLAFGGGRLFATTGYGEVLAYSGQDGRLQWRRRIGPPLRAAPAFSGGRLFVVTVDNRLVALDAATGEVLWEHRGIEEVAGLLGGATPAVGSGVVVVAYSSGEVYALRVENGVIAWTDSLSYASALQSLGSINDINGDPVIDRGRVFAASYGGRLVAFDLRAGVVVWDADVASNQTPWVAGDYLFIVDEQDLMLCLSWADGRARWVTQLPRTDEPGDQGGEVSWSGPILVGDRLIVTGSDGRLIAVSPYTGAIMGQIDLGAGIDVPPVAAGGAVYVLTREADLVSLR